MIKPFTNCPVFQVGTPSFMGFSLDTSVVIDLNSGLSFPNRLKSIASVSSLMPHIQGQAPRIRLREVICFLPSDVIMGMVTSIISPQRKENLDRSSAASQFSPTDGASPVVASLSHYCTRAIFDLRFNLPNVSGSYWSSRLT